MGCYLCARPLTCLLRGLGMGGVLPEGTPVPLWPLPYACVCGGWEARGWMGPNPLALLIWYPQDENRYIWLQSRGQYEIDAAW